MFSNNYFMRIMHHCYHHICTDIVICMVCPLCGYGHGPSNYHCVRIEHHSCHFVWFIRFVDTDMFLQITTLRELCNTCITFVWFIPCVDADMCLQITTLRELCTTGITFEWFAICVDTDIFFFFKLLLCEHCAPQISHVYGLFPVWIRTREFKLQLCENSAPQLSHLNGLSPVWIRICFFKLPLSENCAPRVSHL